MFSTRRPSPTGHIQALGVGALASEQLPKVRRCRVDRLAVPADIPTAKDAAAHLEVTEQDGQVIRTLVLRFPTTIAG